MIVVLALLGTVGVGAFLWLRSRGATEPIRGQERCVASAGGRSVAVDLDQAHFASIIVGVSVRRGLAPRAASIALATVYQETGIRNLDYGDRDSVGLFQQRPSQGWGTVEQLQDPYYATGKFYDALVEVDGWESGDINDVAQRVQRSGYPEAYRDHEADGRVLASVLTGSSPAALTCLEWQEEAGDVDALVARMQKALGKVDHTVEGGAVTVYAGRAKFAWAYGHHAVANAARYGVREVTVSDRTWRTDVTELPGWESAAAPVARDQVTITLR